MSEQYELSIMLFDATGKAVRPVFSRKVPVEIGEQVFDALTLNCFEDELDHCVMALNPYIVRPHRGKRVYPTTHASPPPEPECTCYEIIGGHQQGCAFYGAKAETVTITLLGQNCPHCGEAIS